MTTYSDNTAGPWTSATTNTVYITQAPWQAASTAGSLTINGPVTLTASAPPAPRTEVDRLLAEVDAFCALAR